MFMNYSNRIRNSFSLLSKTKQKSNKNGLKATSKIYDNTYKHAFFLNKKIWSHTFIMLKFSAFINRFDEFNVQYVYKQ